LEPCLEKNKRRKNIANRRQHPGSKSNLDLCSSVPSQGTTFHPVLSLISPGQLIDECIDQGIFIPNTEQGHKQGDVRALKINIR